MGVCPKCGEPISPDAEFCLSCGWRIVEKEKPQIKDSEEDIKLIEKGKEYIESKKYEKALEKFNEALKLKKSPEALFYKALTLKEWGLSLGDNKKLKSSLEIFAEYEELYPPDAKLWYNRGVILATLGNYKKAADCYEKALRLDPGNPLYRRSLETIEKPKVSHVTENEGAILKKVNLSEKLDLPFPKNYVCLVSGPPGVGKHEYCLQLVKKYLEKGENIVYITTERSPTEIKKMMRRLGVDITLYEGKRFIFIDIYSHTTGERYEKALRVDNPANLNAISVQLSKAIDIVGKPARIFFDSISNLFLYAAEPEIKKFFGTLSSRIKSEYGFILYTLQEDMHDEKTVIALKAMVDAVLEMRFEEGPPLKRYFRVHHAKGLKISPQWYEFTIEEDGIRIVTEKVVEKKKVKPKKVSTTIIKAGVVLIILIIGTIAFQLISPGTEKEASEIRFEPPSQQQISQLQKWIEDNPGKWEELKAKYKVEKLEELSKEEASQIIEEFVSVSINEIYSFYPNKMVRINGKEVPAFIEVKNRIDPKAPNKGWLLMETPFYRIELNLDHPYYLLRDKLNNRDVLVYNDTVENPIDMITGSDMGFADHSGENKIQWSTTALHDSDGITRYKVVFEDKKNGFVLIDTEGWDVLSQEPFSGYDIEGEVMFGLFTDRPYFIDATELNNLQEMGLALPKKFRNPDEIVKSWVLNPEYSSAVIKGGDPNHLNRRLYEELYEVRDVANVGRKPYHFGSTAISKMFPTHYLFGDKRSFAIIFSLPEGKFRWDDSLGVYGEQITGEFILYVDKPQPAVSFSVEPVNELEFLYDIKDFSTIEGYQESMKEILQKYGLEYPGEPIEYDKWVTKRFAYVITLTKNWYNPATNKPIDEAWNIADKGLEDFKNYEDIIYKQMEATLPLALMLAGR